MAEDKMTEYKVAEYNPHVRERNADTVLVGKNDEYEHLIDVSINGNIMLKSVRMKLYVRM
jgi:hypothetical protein